MRQKSSEWLWNLKLNIRNGSSSVDIFYQIVVIVMVSYECELSTFSQLWLPKSVIDHYKILSVFSAVHTTHKYSCGATYLCLPLWCGLVLFNADIYLYIFLYIYLRNEMFIILLLVLKSDLSIVKTDWRKMFLPNAAMHLKDINLDLATQRTGPNPLYEALKCIDFWN